MIPNLISSLRIFCILPVIFFILQGNSYFAFTIFLIAGATDFFDGYVARRLGQESPLGANLDLLADKLRVCALFIFISFHFDNLFFLLAAILIVSREISISIIRQYYLSIRKESKAKVNFFGKFKTFFQISSIGLAILFLDSEFSHYVEFCALIAAVLSWISLLYYFYEEK